MAEGCGGRIHSGAPDLEVRRVCTDSRAVQSGDLFIALSGENFDGHNFLSTAAGRGAAALVFGFSKAAALPSDCAAIEVDDTRAALGRLAARYRNDFDLPVVAVGGSNGKTTTKEVLATLLRQKFSTLWSEASFNNDIGVPLTLLRLDASHRAAVLEIGTNHPGELAPLIRMIQPRYGIVTSIGREHLEFFGDLAGVAREEGTLAEMLPADGKLFINGDTPMVDVLTRRSRATSVRVGFGATNHWRVTDVKLDGRGTAFTVESPVNGFSGAYRVGLFGRHHVINAVLALAVAVELGVSRSEAEAGFAACAPAKMRLQLRECAGFQILDDSYNANADSMVAALETLRDLPCQGRRIAVLGDMAELGDQAWSAHMEVGSVVARCHVSRLFAVGTHTPVFSAAARAAGLTAVEEFPEADAASKALKAMVAPGDLILVKASRSARLERIVEALQSRS